MILKNIAYESWRHLRTSGTAMDSLPSNLQVRDYRTGNAVEDPVDNLIDITMRSVYYVVIADNKKHMTYLDCRDQAPWDDGDQARADQEERETEYAEMEYAPSEGNY